jgi:hypothetical protein
VPPPVFFGLELYAKHFHIVVAVFLIVHVDGYVLLAPSRVVLVDACNDKEVEVPMWRAHDIALLEDIRVGDGKRMRVKQVLTPRPRYCKGYSESFAATYLNVYVANGAVVGARFGDPEQRSVNPYYIGMYTYAPGPQLKCLADEGRGTRSLLAYFLPARIKEVRYNI